MPVGVQQPLGHDVASQTHWPDVTLHSWPCAHPTQAAPPAPHDMFVSFERLSQVPADVQQPVHDVPPQEQTPLEHVCAEPHVPQAAPPVPHSELVCEA